RLRVELADAPDRPHDCDGHEGREQEQDWRRHPDSNWGWSFCRALPYHLAMSPILERVAGIEPARQPWEGRRLPLHHTRVSGPTSSGSRVSLTVLCSAGCPGLRPGAVETVKS